jgi:hypothetical protein
VSDEELVARINMADAKFSFQEKGKMYQPAWIAPEVQWYSCSLIRSLFPLLFFIREFACIFKTAL